MPTLIDLTASGAEQTINGAIITDTENVGSGTGNYDTFLAFGDNDGNELGFNSDLADPSNPDIGASKTHTLQIGNLVVVNRGGVDYYEFRLDINEVTSGDNENISLDQLKVYTSSSGTLKSLAELAGLTPVYDLDAGGDKTVLLTQDSSGSGTDDYSFFIPVSAFAGLPLTTFVYLFADMGEHDINGFDVSDGFEEFRALTQDFTPIPRVEIVKETNGHDNLCDNILVGEDVTWTYTVTNPGDLELSNVVVTDDNGTPSNLLDDFHPTFSGGDTDNDGRLDSNETWIFTATLTGGAVAGEYTNIASVTGAWSFGGNNGTVNSSEGDCYNGLTASLSILKQTDGTDGQCLNLIAGSTVNWTYDVMNTGTSDINGNTITVTDDNGTPGGGLQALDDFNAAPVISGGFNTGDVNLDGILNPGETWHYNASGTVTLGEYTNTATVNGTAHDDLANTAPVSASESDCYDGSTPSIDIVKETNGTDDLCPVVAVGEAVTWTYDVANNSAFDISNVVVTDDNGTPGGGLQALDDFSPAAILSGGFNTGDANLDGILNPGETWHYSTTGTAQLGHYENIATVNGTATDENNNTAPVSNSESDCYLGLEGPCPRTPGFWSNWTDFWDGDSHVPKQAGQHDFPTGDLLLQHVDSDNNGSLDALGLLIGDYNGNGFRDGSEDVIFISLNNALSLINASNKQMSDGVVKIGRDTVATWLNYLMGTNIGDASDDGSPHHFIDDAIDYLQIFGDSGSGNGDTGDVFDTYASNHGKVATSSPFWNSDFPGGDHSGSEIHSALDGYNNTGTINGIVYAASCDNEQFLNELSGFSLNGVLSLNSVNII